MIERIVTAFLAAVFIENFVLVKFLGICPFLGVSKKLNTALGMGVSVIFVMGLSSGITWLLQKYLLDRFLLAHLQTIAFILVIAALVQFVEIVIAKFSRGLYVAMGVYLPLITTNCAILGVSLLNQQNELALFDSILYGIFAGIGFTLALVLFAGIRERLEYADIPDSFKGLPISLVAAAFVSLAFTGFQGLI